MEFNKCPNVNEYPSAHSSTNSNFFTLLALTDDRLRAKEVDPRIRQELREAIVWEMDKERMRREIIMAKIVELRNSAMGMSLEERIGRKAALKNAIRKYGTETISSYRATD